MSRENVEIVRRSFEQFSREGWEPLIGTVWDPEIVWNMSPTGIPGLGTYRGSDELRSFFEDWFSTFPFEEWEQELDEVIDCGERVVALTRQRGRGSGSGAVAELAYAQVIKLREGKVVEVDMYIDRDKALEAAGLSEQAMSQENVEATRRANAALNRGDFDGLVEVFAPDAVLEDLQNAPD